MLALSPSSGSERPDKSWFLHQVAADLHHIYSCGPSLSLSLSLSLSFSLSFSCLCLLFLYLMLKSNYTKIVNERWRKSEMNQLEVCVSSYALCVCVCVCGCVCVCV